MSNEMGSGFQPGGAALPQPQWELGDLFNAGWDLFKKNVGLLIGATLLFWLVMAGANMFTWGLAGLVVGGPLTLGLFALILKIVRGEQAEIGVMFSGFQRFLPALLANLLISVFVGIGIVLCVIPGLIVMALYMLTFLYMYDKGMDFWPAMEASRQQVMANFGKWLVLGIVIVALNLVGSIPCGLGLLVTSPLSMLMIALAYERTEHPVAAV